jgi:hypothetical protein
MKRNKLKQKESVFTLKKLKSVFQLLLMDHYLKLEVSLVLVSQEEESLMKKVKKNSMELV